MDYKLIKPYLIEFLTLLITVIAVRLFLIYFGIGSSDMTLKSTFSWEHLLGLLIGYIIILIVRYLYQNYIYRK